MATDRTAADRLREMDAKATSGTWSIYGDMGDIVADVDSDGFVRVLPNPECTNHKSSIRHRERAQATANARIACALRNALPELAAVLDAGQGLRTSWGIHPPSEVLPWSVACQRYDAAVRALDARLAGEVTK